MSNHETELPERLRSVGATSLERRLLEAASRERPSPDLSERMAQGLGIALPAASLSGATSATAGAKVATTGSAASTTSSLLPWVSGALVAGGALVAYVTWSEAKPPAPVKAPAVMAPSASSPAVPREVISAPAPATEVTPRVDEDTAPKASASLPRSNRGSTGGELSNQIALVDAARSALTGGSAQRALSIVREYQTQYPNGTFRPEVAAIKIEALVKLGRMIEARTLAERFVVGYGPGPLANRVARLAQIAEP